MDKKMILIGRYDDPFRHYLEGETRDSRPIVTLTDEELKKAVMVGVNRMLMNIRRNAGQTHRKEDQGLSSHIVGAVAECAVAKFYEKPWDGNMGDYDAADVGEYQVRSSEHIPESLSLLLHKQPGEEGKRGDKDEDWFFLAQVDGNRVKIHGYVTGKVGRDYATWKTYRSPAYYLSWRHEALRHTGLERQALKLRNKNEHAGSVASETERKARDER